MKRKVNLAEAKATLSELIDAALAGEEIVIARRNIALVRLVVVSDAKVTPRVGLLAGRIHMADDFDAPLTDFAAYGE